MVKGWVSVPLQVGVDAANPLANAEKAPVVLVTVSASTLPPSAITTAEATKIGFICGPPTKRFYNRRIYFGRIRPEL
jgi:hypothetical protein